VPDKIPDQVDTINLLPAFVVGFPGAMDHSVLGVQCRLCRGEMAVGLNNYVQFLNSAIGDRCGCAYANIQSPRLN
jgi:hypothetical protein